MIGLYGTWILYANMEFEQFDARHIPALKLLGRDREQLMGGSTDQQTHTHPTAVLSWKNDLMAGHQLRKETSLAFVSFPMR